ncbi:MAG: hypothetical protein CVU09_00450 [Bacteroidetes bacterium HGW-Bacteroidetes-4]|jgi:hypothetical protein|nr:MAG: hypothetical protein CVU09_00450 [Bacteroidetes bacterium HGW-Bacteroidetes-4]
MNDDGLLIAGIISIVLIIFFIRLSVDVRKIRLKQNSNSYLKNKAIAKIIANSNNYKEATIEYLATVANYYSSFYSKVEDLEKQIKRSESDLIGKANITNEELNEVCKMVLKV